MTIEVNPHILNKIFETGNDFENRLTEQEKLFIQLHIEVGLNSGRNIRSMSAPVSCFASLIDGCCTTVTHHPAKSRKFGSFIDVLSYIKERSSDGNILGIYKIFARKAIPTELLEPLDILVDNLSSISEEKYSSLFKTQYVIRSAVIQETEVED